MACAYLADSASAGWRLGGAAKKPPTVMQRMWVRPNMCVRRLHRWEQVAIAVPGLEADSTDVLMWRLNVAAVGAEGWLGRTGGGWRLPRLPRRWTATPSLSRLLKSPSCHRPLSTVPPLRSTALGLLISQSCLLLTPDEHLSRLSDYHPRQRGSPRLPRLVGRQVGPAALVHNHHRPTRRRMQLGWAAQL